MGPLIGIDGVKFQRLTDWRHVPPALVYKQKRCQWVMIAGSKKKHHVQPQLRCGIVVAISMTSPPAVSLSVLIIGGEWILIRLLR
jgi:hypothetical protein